MKAAIVLLLIGYNFYLCIVPAPVVSALPLTKPATKITDPYSLLHAGEPLLREGDLVLRMNNDPLSGFIKNFNRKDKKYSHAGIVLMENGKPVIYHIINDERQIDGKMKKDSLGAFADPRQNSAYGIFRYRLSDEELKGLKKKILQWYKKGLRFDPSFNLKTDNKMYCSEMVQKLLGYATKQRIRIDATRLTDREALWFGTYAHLNPADMKGMRIVAMDDLYMNKYCERVDEYSLYPQ